MMKISRTLLTLGAILGTCVSSSITASARSEISVITNNRQVWQYSPSDLAHRFEGFGWRFSNGGYPDYILIDKNGKVVARGKRQSKAKIENL